MNEFNAHGLCPLCRWRSLQHGPWTPAQVQEAAQDIGCAPDEFEDWCDDCFVCHVGLHDVKHATELAGRPLVLTEPRYVVQQAGIAGLMALFWRKP
ncbi:hypothetical protein [Xenophilus sp.]|uniref:hypothetical protein n=1 Tax=Xenophilus sp. TaxID=1873499 RepID=UPI0037DBF351